jgi:RNA polymerase sigma-70 factor, ECF subfamily
MGRAPPAEESLVQGLRDGDAGAYEALVRAHIGRLLNLARRLLGDESEAEDAVQEAFLGAWRGIHGFDGRSSIGTWLHRIAVRASLARLRARSRRQEVSLEALNGAADGGARLAMSEGAAAGPPDPAVAELGRRLWRAIEELPEEHRTVLLLRDVEEMASKEVAELLGLSDASVRQRLHRARRAVADRLRPDLVPERDLVCGGRLDLLFDLIDGELAPPLRDQVSAHVSGCDTCRDIFAGASDLVAASRRTVLDHPLPERLVDQLIGRILAAPDRDPR